MATSTPHDHVWWPVFWDTDSYSFTAATDAVVMIEAETEYTLRVRERMLPDGDCALASWGRKVTVTPGTAAMLSLSGYGPDTPGDLVIWPLNQAHPFAEYDYVLRLSGLAPGPVAIERSSLIAIKALFQ